MSSRGMACMSLPVGRGSTSGPAGTLQIFSEYLDLSSNLVPASLVQFPGVPRATQTSLAKTVSQGGPGTRQELLLVCYAPTL